MIQRGQNMTSYATISTSPAHNKSIICVMVAVTKRLSVDQDVSLVWRWPPSESHLWNLFVTEQ